MARTKRDEKPTIAQRAALRALLARRGVVAGGPVTFAIDGGTNAEIARALIQQLRGKRR